MSKIAVNEITDEVGTGSPAFTNGLAQSDIAGALNATGTAPIYACRAWVSFDGFDGSIIGSGNVSSLARNNEGIYTINFATAMPDADYAVSGTGSAFNNNLVLGLYESFSVSRTASLVQVVVAGTSDRADLPIVSFQLFR